MNIVIRKSNRSSGTFTYDYLTGRRNCKYKFNMDAFAEYLYNNLGWEVVKSKGSGEVKVVEAQ